MKTLPSAINISAGLWLVLGACLYFFGGLFLLASPLGAGFGGVYLFLIAFLLAICLIATGFLCSRVGFQLRAFNNRAGLFSLVISFTLFIGSFLLIITKLLSLPITIEYTTLVDNDVDLMIVICFLFASAFVFSTSVYYSRLLSFIKEV